MIAFSSEERESVEQVYHDLIGGWNGRNAAHMARLFFPDGNVVGFDGSQSNGVREIEEHLAGVFAHHETPPFVTIIREARLVSVDVAIVRADVGMLVAGELYPAANAIQSLVLGKAEGKWKIALFQNTPAAFHGRPEEAERFSEALRQVMGTQGW